MKINWQMIHHGGNGKYTLINKVTWVLFSDIMISLIITWPNSLRTLCLLERCRET
jgi:hypothetical protein